MSGTIREVRSATPSLGSLVSDWYAVNPDVRRMWIYERGASDSRGARAVHVVVALAPVCDSDDTSPIWLARSARWQRELQRLIGRTVRLDWFDADTDAAPCAEDPAQAGVCLATVAWRDPVH